MQRYGHASAAVIAAVLLGTVGVQTASGGNDLAHARQELQIAIERAERSLAEHQPGSGHTKLHMQQVLNVLEGREGKHFNAKTENPGDGTGVIKHLAAAEGMLAPAAQQAIIHARTFIQEAIEHAHRSVRAGGIEETHHHAALAAGLLQAAAGREGSRSPVTGALAYALMKEES
jgi:hypothetical protein